MESISHISKEAFEYSELSGVFSPLRILKTIEDVATLIEIFECATTEVNTKQIEDVVSDEEGNYLFIINGDSNKFDLYGFINENYRGITAVNCVNAKLLFPRSKSRGMFTWDVAEDEEEDIATGFIDEEDTGELGEASELRYRLYYEKLDSYIPIPEEGVIFGRSSKQSTYVIHGNSNVSRKHAKVFRNGSSYFVENYKPPNGTYIDGLRMRNDSTTEIYVGSTLMIADEEFKLV